MFFHWQMENIHEKEFIHLILPIDFFRIHSSFSFNRAYNGQDCSQQLIQEEK